MGWITLGLTTQISRLHLRPTHHPIQWLPDVRHLNPETDHSTSSSAEVKNDWSYPLLPPYAI